jgi:hypothetical protein
LKCKSRFEKNRDTLFTFLHYDLGARRNGPSSAYGTGPSERTWVCVRLIGSAANRASLR